ncbi:syntaxin-6-like [Dreissena polymorpha]|uniref:syntaxin-6-like n=1 Tax=Dreissena polymorpha TaxID=45954 RepID=UPI002263AF41|nr:syntaxin-6-like [Dreissena polymorpha]XP_052221531.1 syntaxin-6-like [Dreissena polymorpha]XP_052221532.1 syntaxin-6-like [Dreissena polymorpha]XP_052221534.1 syntaxin-6-like [Dreissena polymorpha]XP_052221535.1 syntaxin-6-like [Dreissena polymorpha]XP_052221536.1 syntaxin-6-like [Dreissena polymorpha]XP_052221537.1 syntaxin-6-like [Dreissena polymorpha]XP_052221538.1 syntaxin-6-like [Dreissena polymorpha]XP_052221539.1 syntaxin-6-like [Dreissena polymorpha]XP_052221540.1 syntaxin-6-lik
MSLEDPFFVVKEEVEKALQTSKNLYTRWCQLADQPSQVSVEEYNWTTNELRNSLRSIDWDVEDLEETVGIVEKNPKKFRIEVSELKERRDFIERTKSAVREMKSQMTSPQIRTTEDTNVRQSLLNPKSPSKVYDKYSRLDMEAERSHQSFIDDTTQHQQLIIKDQDEQLDLIGSSVGALKNMSHQIGNELEEQNRMLDDFGHEMEVTESRMDNVMKKMAKVLHMSSDKRQCCAIGVLLVILLIVIILLVVL